MKDFFYWVIILLLAVEVRAGVIEGTVNYPYRGAGRRSPAVVYAMRIPKEPLVSQREAVIIDQINLEFVPHVLPIAVGTRVRFPNSDEVRHNVFSFSPAKLFNLGIYLKGESREITFDRPGEIVLLCTIHTEMSAYVLVLETPYFTVASEEGSYQLPDLPPGDYRVTVWHEEFESVSTRIRIASEKKLPLAMDLVRRR